MHDAVAALVALDAAVSALEDVVGDLERGRLDVARRRLARLRPQVEDVVTRAQHVLVLRWLDKKGPLACFGLQLSLACR